MALVNGARPSPQFRTDNISYPCTRSSVGQSHTFQTLAEIARLIAALQRLPSVNDDLALRTMTRPLTLWVHEVDKTPNVAPLGQWCTGQLFSMLDEFSNATLERVDDDHDAQFLLELAATSDPSVMTLLLRESIIVMASEQIAATAGLDQWEAIATQFATMIDMAAECYATPLTTV